ncbi:MAG TPA: biosynthetic-type acetolactate synthase large subunit [Bacteroidales bacterium]|nr:biosynthetic-type acetolactate synthase large subunit [Bacteroidales bacterium]HPO64597.1 biosynthetic-type acetolactate synthase large subunit [Bacteroidales bacterium]
MSETRKITGSEAVILSLIEEGTEVIFGYPGGAIMPVYDALYGFADRIKHVLTRHEQGAIHAAEGYARATGKVGVVMATSGPGATNLITGIADAMIDSTPIVAITGQVGAALLGTDAFQETDVVGISMPVTKWNIQVTRPEDIPGAIAKAFYIARSGRPGPVLIDLTKNAQFGTLDYKYEKCHFIRSYVPKPTPDESKIIEAAKLINSAQKPYVLVGQGVILANAEEEFRAFIEKSGIPFAWTLLGASAMPIDHPLNVGMLGMHGNYAPNIKTNECDVLIAVGMRFDDRVTGDLNRYAKQAKVIHLEIDPAEVDKNVKTTVAVLGDVKETLPLLTRLVEKRDHSQWRKEFDECYEIEKQKVIQHEMYPSKPGLTMAEVIRRINEQTNGDAIIVTDVGQHQMIASRYFKYTNKRSLITSGGLGTMGFGLPAAMGAKIGKPDKQVICVVGDGGLQMTIQEFGTIMEYNIPVKIVLLNNHFLGMVRQWQQLFFERRYSMTELKNPDFMKVAEGYELNHQKVTERAQLDEAISNMLKSDKAFLLEVVVEKEDNVFPMVPSGASVSDILLEATN